MFLGQFFKVSGPLTGQSKYLRKHADYTLLVAIVKVYKPHLPLKTIHIYKDKFLNDFPYLLSDPPIPLPEIKKVSEHSIQNGTNLEPLSSPGHLRLDYQVHPMKFARPFHICAHL